MEQSLFSFCCLASALALLATARQLAWGRATLRATTGYMALALVGVLGWSAERLAGLLVAHRGGLPDETILWLPLVLSGFVTFSLSFSRHNVSSSGVAFARTRWCAVIAWSTFLPVAYLDITYV